MFDVSWSELLILGLVTLIFVGPKELPRFLGTLGRYMGVVRRHANEFRAVFDQAMREAELDQLQKDVREVGEGMKSSIEDAARSVESATSSIRYGLDAPDGTGGAGATPATGELASSGSEPVIGPPPKFLDAPVPPPEPEPKSETEKAQGPV